MAASATDFLQNATPEQLLQAVEENHKRWFTCSAKVAAGTTPTYNGTLLTVTWGEKGEMQLLFPHLSDKTAGDTLDFFVAECRHRPIRQAACWSLLPSRPTDLGARLVARGFEWGWQPHWMALDLARMPEPPPLPDGARVEPVADDVAWEVEDLPYYERSETRTYSALARTYSRSIRRFVAWKEGRVVAHASIALTRGKRGVAGLYSIGTVPALRRQGLGAAVTLAACRWAQAQGCRYATLNATGAGELLYRRLGFESLGYGQTWWLHRRMMDAKPPSPHEISFVEAVGRGDMAELTRMRPRLPQEWVDAVLLSGMRPLELAVKMRQPAAVEWLAEQGAVLDPLSAWELGWKERIPELLAQRPEVANYRSGPDNTTPLHTAAWNNDLELIELLLAGGADPTLKDTTYQSTPIGWARHGGHSEAAERMEAFSQERGG